MGRFKLVKKGDTPTLLDSEQVNLLYEFLNALEDLQVSPTGMGKLTFGKKNAVLDLAPVQALVTKLQQLQAAIDGTTAAGTGSGGSGTSASVTTTINAIIASLNAATITLACNPSTGDITGTIVIPNLPSPL